MEHETVYGVVNKLIGDIVPIGNSNTDEIRLKNLIEMICLVDRLLSDIYNVAGFDERVEDSMKQAGTKARKFLSNLDEWK